jgi:hypothetical protein
MPADGATGGTSLTLIVGADGGKGSELDVRLQSLDRSLSGAENALLLVVHDVPL